MNKKSTITDMTSGSSWKLILFFALPLMAGNVFQQLYTVVDTMIVGQAVGVNALAAVGSTDWFNWMAISMLQGFTQGFGILIAQKFGEKDYRQLNEIAAASIVLSAILALLFLICMQLAIVPALMLLQIPLDIRPLSETYLRIYFAGIPVSMAYNLLAVILRSLGDSRSPLNAMVIATLLNILLDLLFVLVLGLGVGGAAAATVMSQLVSAVYCYLRYKNITILRISRKDLSQAFLLVLRRGQTGKTGRSWAPDLLKLGFPMACQNMIIASGGVILQSIVDTFGVVFIAGFTATNKLYGLLECAAVAYGYALITYTGQNLGAGNIRRIREGVFHALVIAAFSCMIISAFMLTEGKQILSLFISGSPEEAELALDYAFSFLKLMSLWLPVLYVLHIIRSSLQGLGHTRTAMFSGICELIMRVLAALILPVFFGERSLFWAEILAWLGADAVLIGGYFYHIRKLSLSLKQRLH